MLGDAQPETGTPDVARATFSDNSVLSVGFTVGKPDANPKAPSLSFTVRPKEERPQGYSPTEPPPAASGAAGDGYDDIPF